MNFHSTLRDLSVKTPGISRDLAADRAFVALLSLCEGHKGTPTRAMEINHQRPLCNLATWRYVEPKC